MSVLAAILPATTSLHLTFWPNGQGHAPKRSYTLACAPAGGTLPHRLAACRHLARLKAPFAPTPPTTACTRIYGGPNGCEIERWNRVAFLFPAT